MENVVKARKKSLAESMIADAASMLVRDEMLKTDSKAMTGAVIALRQVVIALEKRGFCLAPDTERCFEIISVLERGEGN